MYYNFIEPNIRMSEMSETFVYRLTISISFHYKYEILENSTPTVI